ncbi:hypothetical protein BOTBODRAFT_187726 [Botryobasidium botryosum FD-172 SS1]|uniref:DRBM domain-containing protein n=1 Tax=Botryobasidium botryosum (strain FD-172 SS1) TaxID=930990 RepID=A0A067MS54_BOTB1|nr:hypothetical protein BOTBODRAFT_187726 [Botryobasidium botryosum FD-172 SS1]
MDAIDQYADRFMVLNNFASQNGYGHINLIVQPDGRLDRITWVAYITVAGATYVGRGSTKIAAKNEAAARALQDLSNQGAQ